MAGETEQQRMRSFVERYVCARASHFSVEFEEKDSWECALKARSLYDKINGLSSKYIPKAEEATQTAPTPMPYGGVAGSRRPPNPFAHGSPFLPPAPTSKLQQFRDAIKDLMQTGAPTHVIQRVVRQYHDEIAMAANPPVAVPPSPVDSKGWTG